MAELRERQEEHERKLWEEKLEAKLRMMQQRMEIEKSARATTTKLPKLKITPFKGTPTDWVRFENIFLTQVHEKPITDEDKFGYLLETVCQKVRDKIAGEIGYKTAWDRLKKEYGQTKLVVNSSIEMPVLEHLLSQHFLKIHRNLAHNFFVPKLIVQSYSQSCEVICGADF